MRSGTRQERARCCKSLSTAVRRVHARKIACDAARATARCVPGADGLAIQTPGINRVTVMWSWSRETSDSSVRTWRKASPAIQWIASLATRSPQWVSAIAKRGRRTLSWRFFSTQNTEAKSAIERKSSGTATWIAKSVTLATGGIAIRSWACTTRLERSRFRKSTVGRSVLSFSYSKHVLWIAKWADLGSGVPVIETLEPRRDPVQ